MPAWGAATAVYSVYVMTVAALLPRLTWRARAGATLTALLGTSLAVVSEYTDALALHSLVLPAGSLVLGYYASGFLWRTPDDRIEALLVSADAALHIDSLSARTPRLVTEFLELAYAAIYPLIPISLWLHLRFATSPDADWFWTVILVTDFLCFAMLPWIQTRPPRALEARAPWLARLRRLNLNILDTTSIQMNTVPSGHAAEALACALLLIGAPGGVVALMFAIAAAVSAGALFGRYHYSVDIVAGWIVALAAFSTLSLWR